MYQFIRTHSGKIIAAFLGYLRAGFLGLLIGLLIGFIIDKLHKDGHNVWFLLKRKSKKNTNDIIVSFMVLASSLIKLSGKPILEEELLLKKYLASQIKDNDKIDEYLEFYKKTKLKDWDIPRISQQLKLYNNHETNLQIIHNLFEIAYFDKQINQNELALIKVISIHLNIHCKEYEEIKNLFLGDLHKYYNILEISPNSTVQQIKEAHRKLALKYHPDKNSNHDEDIEYLNSKFQSIQHAFEVIKTEKGFI